MNRLAAYITPDRRTNKVQYILDHLHDQCDGAEYETDEHGEYILDKDGERVKTEYATLTEFLAMPVELVGHKRIATAITNIAHLDGLDLTISAESVARHREKGKR